MINAVQNYSVQEKYSLQPAKCKIIKSGKQLTEDPFNFDLNGERLENVETAVHLGITHHKNNGKTIKTHIDGNISKARRTMYSLMGTGLHGKNGLNPVSCLQLFHVYVLPVLLYGLEILLPGPGQLAPIETFNRKCLKQILSLPNNTGDCAVYILSGTLPLTNRIHRVALGVFGSICRSENSIERELAERQFLVSKGLKESWFTKVKALLIKYNLPSPFYMLDNPPQKLCWKRTVKKEVLAYWTSEITSMSSLYKNTTTISKEQFQRGKLHTSLSSVQTSSNDVQRLPIK